MTAEKIGILLSIKKQTYKIKMFFFSFLNMNVKWKTSGHTHKTKTQSRKSKHSAATGGACHKSNTPCLVSSKLTRWRTCLSALCQYGLGPLVMGHTPNDRSRSFPLPGIINPPSGPCPAADSAERHPQWTCRSTMSYCAVPMEHKHTHRQQTSPSGEAAELPHLLMADTQNRNLENWSLL